ncbi:MAG: pyruvate dehydrogenase [Phototrophicales bacterium]|nr:MAG: pyruvate dehydrogenase [Phototrophicales bacterium]
MSQQRTPKTLQQATPKTLQQLTPHMLKRLWQQALLIRKTEERLLLAAESGELMGTTHCCIGQEANAVALCSQLLEGDFVTSNHRCHGHYIALTDDVEGLVAEVFGRSTGVMGGRGGSQHLLTPRFLSNGILGGTAPIAAGIALSNKLAQENSEQSDNHTAHIVVCFLGDGALGEGIVYEALNMCALWNLPVLFVVENNHIAQSTPIHKNLAGSIEARFEAFGIPAKQVKGFGLEQIYQVAQACIREVRQSTCARALIIDSFRFCHHSVRDECRDLSNIEFMRAQDPLSNDLQKILGSELEVILRHLDERLDLAFENARRAPLAQ